MIRYRHHTLTSLFAVGSTTLSIFSGTIMNYATRSFPTNLPTHGNFILLHRITRGGGNSSVRFVLRNALTNYLRHITLNRIIALNPTFNRHQNKGNLLPNLNPMRHPDISTKHKYMTFLLSYNKTLSLRTDLRLFLYKPNSHRLQTLIDIRWIHLNDFLQSFQDRRAEYYVNSVKIRILKASPPQIRQLL